MKILKDLSLFLFGIAMMAVWRYIFHLVKLDNIQGYDKEFLSRSQATTVIDVEYENQVSRESNIEMDEF